MNFTFTFTYCLVFFLSSYYKTRVCVLQVSLEALKKRLDQGWLHEMESDLDNVIQRIRAAKSTKQVHVYLDLRMFFIDS